MHSARILSNVFNNEINEEVPFEIYF